MELQSAVGITQEQRDAVTKRLNDKASVGACPACRAKNMVVQNLVTAIPASNIPMLQADRQFPAVVVLCQTCGYMMLFNIFSLGVADVFHIIEEK